ncbi:MAG: recombinase family protein [Solirubrobacteraceae bacterium]
MSALASNTAGKVTAEHLARTAFLYVRQSTLRQVVQNTESTQRQYALRQRAIALGWSAERIVVIDSDQGQSGASAADREGFQRLVAEVGVGRAGIVLGLEVSRLARNNADWHRLLEICGLSGTLICDEDGLYDPAEFNDRLLLGLKGTMSEAELHFIRARLRGGQLSKARRGELRMGLPVGLVYDPAGNVVLDPDSGVQHAISHLFETFERTGSARAGVSEEPCKRGRKDKPCLRELTAGSIRKMLSARSEATLDPPSGERCLRGCRAVPDSMRSRWRSATSCWTPCFRARGRLRRSRARTGCWGSSRAGC